VCDLCISRKIRKKSRILLKHDRITMSRVGSRNLDACVNSFHLWSRVVWHVVSELIT